MSNLNAKQVAAVTSLNPSSIFKINTDKPIGGPLRCTRFQCTPVFISPDTSFPEAFQVWSLVPAGESRDGALYAIKNDKTGRTIEAYYEEKTGVTELRLTDNGSKFTIEPVGDNQRYYVKKGSQYWTIAYDSEPEKMDNAPIILAPFKGNGAQKFTFARV